MKLFTDLSMNIRCFNETFSDCGDIVMQRFYTGGSPKTEAFIIYADSMTDRATVEQSVMRRLLEFKLPPGIRGNKELFAAIACGGIATPDFKENDVFEEINVAVMSGDTAVLFDGFDAALVISTKGSPNRGVPTVEAEAVVQGAKDSFGENFRFNTVLIRRRIRDTNLKVKQMKIGRRSSTDIALMYLDDVVRKEILEEAERRLQSIDIDAILDCGYIEQLIEDDKLSPFPQALVTERPDKAASAILEGRIAIIVDNSPYALIIPSTFNTFFQSSEDYYQRFGIMSVTRAIRFAAAFVSISLPGLYIAITVFHPSMLPMLLALKMAGAQQDVPFPAVIEILIMEFAFELLREAGIRLPKPVGSAIGIVGGLIVGQAAVEAGIVSPIVVIIIALTGICGFVIPNYQLTAGFRLVKYLVITLSAAFGFFGFWAAMIIILTHLSSLKVFGIPYLFPFQSGGANDYSDFKDTLFRAPFAFMKTRPVFANPKQRVRMRLK